MKKYFTEEERKAANSKASLNGIIKIEKKC